ncbi:hypothetical protein BDZ94DRAFT_326832 [Collybia nuda]|uniref:F-box domain-containing protein n=1 Tax=Collybia nuda TaxID=64659 RepID=A0A9P5Y915_9AGAR|nr:hypothetical protein BDZ94DRAFT_326832 [Collybia nuda]
MLSHYEEHDNSSLTNKVPDRTKKPLYSKEVTGRLKLLDEEIENIRSAKFQRGVPSYDIITRLANSLEKAPSFFERAPVEIMSAIFMACLPHWGKHVEYSSKITGPNTMDRAHAPWALPQVCSRWRAIALSLPQLWSRIVIRPDLMRSEMDLKILLLSLEISLFRSASAPLFVWLQASEHYRMMNLYRDPWKEILDALTRHSERWQDAIFSLHPVPIGQLAKIQGRLPKLRRLRLHILRNVNNRVIGRFEAFSQAPSLRQFEIVGSRTTNPDDPFMGLRFHRPRAIPAGAQVQLLHQMPLVTHASFHLEHAFRVHPPPPHCTHEHLRSLSIKHEFLLDNLTLPALKALSLKMSSNLDAVVPFIQRSSCVLISMTLGIWNKEISETDLTAVFEATPELTSLALTDYSHAMTENAISRLVFHPYSTEPCLLPKLRHLEISKFKHADRVIEMIESRWRIRPLFSANRIHSTRLHISTESMHTNLLSNVEHLRKEGLDIHIYQ